MGTAGAYEGRDVSKGAGPMVEDAFEVRLRGGAHALFTTRAAGNLSLSAGAGHEHGLAARDRLCEELGLRWLCAGPQVHGVHVQRVVERSHCGGAPVAEAADGRATALPGIGAMVLAADCVPVVLGARGTVAAVHAGWRGLAAGVLLEGVRALRELGGRGTLHAVIGPCAGSCCYEVGEEVLQALGASAPAAGSKSLLDLRAHARARLRDAGVAIIEEIELCTICEPRLFSHRREGGAAGRQAAIAWLP